MNVKKLAGTIVCSVALVAGGVYFLTPSKMVRVEAKVVGYKNVEALEREADYIVVGHLEKDFSEYEPTFNYSSVGRVGEFYTKTDVIIDKILKGETDTKIIPVLQDAAYIDSPTKHQDDLLTIEGYTPMEKGREYLLFLSKTNDGESYNLLGVYQGKFDINESESKAQGLALENSHYQKLKDEVEEKYKDIFEK
ncbi:hypothetical protein [Brevibacillus laterosporus]|uniref:hypothetical protein n=1 Tax=Brevibacillus laterosporus TaxID=1465 RepID=UPI000CE346EB|nr:hypothetical protein [Brevibacillus laterosporus]MED1665963.1 hypothetical protein [Brevibacillus laterosporus]MED1667364.1 hypothetical protein [Brevibacillus laterosporus]MED1717212.1 hypothetical protein [Brevibacillus laterosporus]PPA87223.1 hypothetical protein C4A76_12255 [Brevibacillus laterosporus]